MKCILRSLGWILLGCIHQHSLSAQLTSPAVEKPTQVRMLGASFRTTEPPVPGKWLKVTEFTWEDSMNIRLQAAQPLQVKWNTAQDSLLVEAIPGEGGGWLASNDNLFRFRGQFLAWRGSLEGQVEAEAPGFSASGGELEVYKGKISMSEAILHFQTLDSGRVIVEISGDFEYDPIEAKMNVSPALSSFMRLCDGNWHASVNEGVYDLRTHELSFSDPRGISSPLYFDPTIVNHLPNWPGGGAYLDPLSIRVNTELGWIIASGFTGFRIADVRVFPSEGSLTIDRFGHIRELMDAEILVEPLEGRHEFASANVTFPTCSTYAAKGFYKFVNAAGQEQRIPMDLRLQGDTLTTAHGEVEGFGFYLNEGFQYRGTLDLDQRSHEIRCKGVIQVDLRHPYFRDKWFPIDQSVDPNFVVLDLFGGDPSDSTLSCGVHLDSLYGPYPTFMGKKYSPQNHDLMQTWGSMAYDGKRRAFSIGSQAILEGKDLRGGVIHFTIDSTDVIAEGPFRFPPKFVPPHANLKCAGYLQEDAAHHEISLNITGSIDLQALPRDAIRKITDKMRLLLAIEESFDPQSPSMQVPLANLLDPDPERKPNNYRKFVQASSNAITSHEINPGERLPYSTLLFSNLTPRWDAQMSSFWHSDKLAILSCAEVGVNKFTVTNTKIEMRAVPALMGIPAHPELRMYIEFDEMNWIYLDFTPDGLSFVSSDVDLMNELRTFKPRKNNKLTLLTEADKDLFLVNFVNRYIWRTGR